MVAATFFYDGVPPQTITLNAGYGEPELAHQLVTMILSAVELPILLDPTGEPCWIERSALTGFAVGDLALLTALYAAN